MDGDDGARPRRDRAIERDRIEAESDRLHVDEDGTRSDLGHRARRREVRERRNDHLVAGRHAHREERERDRGGPRREPDRVPRAARGGQFPLERVVLGAEDELAGGEHAREIGGQLLGQRPMDAGQVEERNGRFGHGALHGSFTVVRASTTGSRPVRSTCFATRAAR
jgi:hypothetical protein